MGELFVVGTPIGNLDDFSKRAIETLNLVDFIAAEDTRVSIKLLNRFSIKKPMISYYEHNLREKGQQIVDRILNGESCAIVSDAGMPCISDPGEDLVRLCAQNNIKVTVIPGPSAAISALAVSGLVTSRFTFEGFLSTNKRNRAEHLKSLLHEERTMIFYEAPHKLTSTLKDMLDAFGDRKITLARELTKIHEQVLRFTLSRAVEYYSEVAPKGEFVLVIEGKEHEEEQREEMTFDELVFIGKTAIQKGEKATDVAKMLANDSKFAKNEIYKALVQ